jgi:hypothetical protein
MSILSFIVAVSWGLLSGQFFMQVVASLINACIYFAAILFSKVRQALNITGFLTSLGMALFFASLTFAGNLISSYFVDYSGWSAPTIVCVLAFVFSVVYCGVQVPGKILLARMSAWSPFFFEAANTFSPHDRLAFARKMRNEK